MQGIQTEALQCVGQLGGLDKNVSLALGKAGVMDGLVLAQTHENPRIKACETQTPFPEPAKFLLDEFLVELTCY